MFIGRDFQTTKSYSEKVAGAIDDEVKLLIDRAYAKCAEILKTNEAQLRKVSDWLLENETMTGAQFRACMEGRQIEADSNTNIFFSQTGESSEE